MANVQLFQSLKNQFPPAATAVNAQAAPAYVLSPKHQLAQYAATGCLNATYYASAEGWPPSSPRKATPNRRPYSTASSTTEKCCAPLCRSSAPAPPAVNQ